MSEHASVQVDGRDLDVVSLSGEEEVSALFRFEVVCRVDVGRLPDTRALRGAPATITLRDGRAERTIGGIVASAALRRSKSDNAELRLEIRPDVHRLTLGRDCYVLHDVDVLGVVKDVLFDHQGPVSYRIARRYRVRDYVAQYREDDWTFLSRLLEDEGIFYWFEGGEGGTTLWFSDESRSAAELDGGAYITYRTKSGMHGDEEHVEELGSLASFAPGRFSIGSFDFNKPLLRVEGAAGGSGLEVYDAPGGGLEAPEDCARRAEVMAEASACAASTVSGKCTSVRLVPGRVLEVGGHPFSRLDGRYFLTKVRTVVQQRRTGAAGKAEQELVISFEGIPADLPFRPADRTPPAKQAGLQTGVVVGAAGSEVHPDPLGRIRVQLHWDRGGAKNDRSGRWMRVAQRSSAGSMLLPRVGWNVASFNEEGTVDAPRVISRLCDAEHMPPYALPANKTRTTYKTATTPGGGSFNEIHFEDKLGAEEMFVNASRDMNILVKNGKTETIQRDSFRAVAVNRSLTVGERFTEAVGRNQTVAIGGNESVDAGGTIATRVGGNETISIGGKRSIKAGDHRITVHQTRTVRVGAAQIDVTLGNVGLQARKDTSTTVGGAIVRLAKDTITESSDIGIQTIGGARLEFAKGGRTLGSSLASVTTVGGIMTMKCAHNYTESAQKTLSWTVGAKLQGESPTVWIEAKKKIVLRSGATTITIEPESVSISTPKFDLTKAAHFEVHTALIEHN